MTLTVRNVPIESVALRKESVDRNVMPFFAILQTLKVALRKESVDRNLVGTTGLKTGHSRSPQGERG